MSRDWEEMSESRRAAGKLNREETNMDEMLDSDSSVPRVEFCASSVTNNNLPSHRTVVNNSPESMLDSSSPISLGVSNNGGSDFENLLHRLGGFGARQRLLLGLSCVPNIFVAFVYFSDSLLTLAPNHHCQIDWAMLPAELRNASDGAILNATLPVVNDSHPGTPGGVRQRQSQCQQFIFENETRRGPVPCQQGWVYYNIEGLRDNMVTQWNLVCDSYWKVPVEEVCFIIGILTGYLLLGCAADRFGRLKSFLFSLFLTVFFGVLVCVSPSPSIFILTRFFLGASTAGVYLCLYITRLELCDPARRLMGTMIAGLFTISGQFLLLGVALGCQSWRGLQGAIVAPLALFLSYGLPGVFPESPRWLLVSGWPQKAKEILQSFSDSRDEELFRELDSVTLFESSVASWEVAANKLLHCRNIWRNICILGFTSFISHGIHHCYGTFRRDVRGSQTGFYSSYLLSAGMGGLACLFLCLTVDKFGRRGILLLTMTLTGIASLVLLGLIEYLNEVAITIFSVLGLFSSYAAAALSVLFAAEVIPTIVRGVGVGLILSLGAVGRLTSPIMDLHNQYGYFLHHVVYTSLALLCILSIMLLPESKRKPLPETLRDGELYRRPSLLRKRRDNVPLLSTPNPSI
ncbi:solute carrier family 22 member 17 [Erpetoichthys calabaricus]|uniref:Major facilitator superfamily (MFS) profile domain-containing protein n=1 Tax=Erpetoichthys calabaricus TaxID=27687 RepID=A0A8C4SH44_ERPCA|nr:solute carrier family 22 member 17 [Erpetoichthys calabaricus]